MYAHAFFWGKFLQLSFILGKVCKPQNVKNYSLFLRRWKRPLVTHHLRKRGLILTHLQIQEPKITGFHSVLQGTWRPGPTAYFVDEKTEVQDTKMAQ